MHYSMGRSVRGGAVRGEGVLLVRSDGGGAVMKEEGVVEMSEE